MMYTKKAMLLSTILITSVFAVSACKKKESPSEALEEQVNDALDRRPYEALKDAAEATEENVKDALNIRENEKMKDAAEDMKEAIDSAADAVTE